MLWTMETSAEMRPKFYINGFPKAGLHLAVLMLSAAVQPMPPGRFHGDNWVGTFGGNAWLDRWEDVRLFTYRMARLRPGCYFKGHAGYTGEISEFMRLAGVAHVFVYRDLRDVAVSQAYHIMNCDGVRFKHPAPEAYRMLGGFDEILSACITGLGPFPGIVARWQYYAGWLKQKWVHCIRYEDIKNDPRAAAHGILEYGLDRMLKPYRDGINVQIEGTLFDKMVGEMANMGQRTELSPTFRKGAPGEWRDKFTPKHIEQFKESDRAGWIGRLGYTW